MKAAFFVFITALAVCGATPAEIDSIISAARSASPEFAADALIRLASLEQLPKEKRLDLLQQAFDRAAGAQQPYQQHAAFVRNDGSTAYWNKVDSQGLDTLTLRVRAVEAMLLLDAPKANALFLSIPTLAIPRVKCEEFQVYDVTRFYDLLATLTSSSTDAPKLLERYTAAIASPVQAGPMAHVLASAKNLKDDEFKTLLASYSAALGKISGDDRSFTYANAVSKQILALTDECQRRSVSPLPLLEAYRLYLVVNLAAVRCADDEQMQTVSPTMSAFAPQPPEEPIGDLVTFFNTRLQVNPLQPIQESEATPAHLEGVATGMRMCQDKECQSLIAEFRKLIIGEDGKPYLPADREKPEWQEKFKGVLKTVAAWKQTKETTSGEFFREKCAAYGQMLSIALNGAAREPALHALLDFVSANDFQTTNRLEWFLPVNGLVGRVGMDPLGLRTFAAELRKSKDPIIALYANLEAVAPRNPGQILPLL